MSFFPKAIAKKIMRKTGYIRVSTDEQNLRSQLDSLNKEGCDLIFKDKATGSNTDRPQLKKALKELEQGDCLVVTNLDCFSRSSLDFLRPERITHLSNEEAGENQTAENISPAAAAAMEERGEETIQGDNRGNVKG